MHSQRFNPLLLILAFIAVWTAGACTKPFSGAPAPEPGKDYALSINPLMRFFHNGRLRGINVGPGNSNERLDYIVQKTGANILRLYFTDDYKLMRKTAVSGSATDPDATYPFIEANFGHLIRILDWAKARGDVKILIDPHTAPGFESDYTTGTHDLFWRDVRWRKHLIKLWQKIIDTVGDRGSEIAGYDLFNEPVIPDPAVCALGDQWNDIVDTLVKVIRSRGAQHPILVQPAGIVLGRNCDGSGGTEQISIWRGISYLQLPDDDNLVVAPHFYAPVHFTHQGIAGRPTGLRYPGTMTGSLTGGYWDKDRMSEELQYLRDFTAAHPGIPVFIGEFSVARAAGPDGDVFINDLLDMTESENWSWAYHAWESLAFNPATHYTNPPSNSNTAEGWQPKTAPRLAILRQYMYKNFTGYPPADKMIRGLYRLRHPSNGDELLTPSLSEVSSALFTYGYHIDGVYGRVAGSDNAAVVPVYALRHPITKDRLYTPSLSEVSDALSIGYEGGGIKFYAATAAGSGLTMPVYRLKKASRHRYAFGGTERDAAIAAGWTPELGGTPVFYSRPNEMY